MSRVYEVESYNFEIGQLGLYKGLCWMTFEL